MCVNKAYPQHLQFRREAIEKSIEAAIEQQRQKQSQVEQIEAPSGVEVPSSGAGVNPEDADEDLEPAVKRQRTQR